MEALSSANTSGVRVQQATDSEKGGTSLINQVTPPRTESPSSDIVTDDKTLPTPQEDALPPIRTSLAELFEENITAKVMRTAVNHLIFNGVTKEQLAQVSSRPDAYVLPRRFPEYVTQTGDNAGTWTTREHSFWTCGFFPGTLYCIFERLVMFPPRQHYGRQRDIKTSQIRQEAKRLSQTWSEPLHAMASRRDTHDVGFMIMPALQKDWELTGNIRSLESIIIATRSLASRYVSGAQAIRSWDARIQKNLQITCQCQNVLLIIDSMCNLDLLYYAARHVDGGGEDLYDIATAHATKLLETHLRPESTTPIKISMAHFEGQWYSTYHVANVDPVNGNIKQQFTAQGYTKESTWARGQAWGILGYAQTYMSTYDTKFLDAACGLSEYFLYRLETCPLWPQDLLASKAGDDRGGRYVPLWDFDAPVAEGGPVRDSSAGSIAANGMLIISQALDGLGNNKLATRFRKAAVEIVKDLLRFTLAPEKAQFEIGSEGIGIRDIVEGQTFEALLKHGTANNNEHAMKRYCDHGIVYGDYYLVEFGNKLLRAGLV